MNVKTCGAAALLLASAILGGCATSRSEVKLTAPGAAQAAVTQQRAVVIRSVHDARQFSDKPSDPSMPSLGSGGASNATEAVKARAIARKRNGFGQALGDILLQDGQTVTGVVRDNLAAAFRQAGYRVVPDVASAGPSPLVVDVTVRKFWAWFTPGMLTVTLACDIDTDLKISDGHSVTNVSVSAKDNTAAATDGAWVAVVDKALAAYRAQAAQRVSSARDL